MLITLFLLSSIIGIAFFMFLPKIQITWIKKSFIIYGISFSITAVVLLSVFLYEHRTLYVNALDSFINKSEAAQTVEPATTYVSDKHIEESVKLEAPQVEQMPELPRGCEVTSLAMLLQYHGLDVDKMELAKQVKKNPTPYRETDKEIYFGNPHNGFVGDMYTFSNPGLGVYHGPIAELAASYLGERVHDFTGGDFQEILQHLNQDRPVWVIINAAYKELPKEDFTTWKTEDGEISITRRLHSVLVTGYDDNYIYFNDPLNREEKAPIDSFKAAWNQMGKQAITVF
ncbi:C39 family peptidase [Oceanobacillus halotolerans]|uniref:C39 family peptidase n=1 Tax=Oceanobacillus halotolerans TaxID=2663380 RepID=UPI001CF77A67|nr:C39 family peptidase [Oceanobacillus halotolerans]